MTSSKKGAATSWRDRENKRAADYWLSEFNRVESLRNEAWKRLEQRDREIAELRASFDASLKRARDAETAHDALRRQLEREQRIVDALVKRS